MRGRFRKEWGRLFAIKDTPRSIALGTALGIFFGFTPLFGLKTLLALLCGFLLRANKIAAVVGVILHDVVLPLRPALYLLEFELGYWLLHRPHDWSVIPRPEHWDLHGWALWRTLATVGGPMLLGAVILGAPMSLLMFIFSKTALTRRQRRRAEATAEARCAHCRG